MPVAFTPKRRRVFLEQLEVVPNIALAARKVGVTTACIRYHRKKSKDFEDLVQESLEVAIGSLEEAARKRGVEGVVRRPIFDRHGNQLGVEMEYSDSLLSKMLSAHHPSYRKQIEVTGAGGSPLKVDLTALGSGDLELLLEAAKKVSLPEPIDAEFAPVPVLAPPQTR